MIKDKLSKSYRIIRFKYKKDRFYMKEVLNNNICIRYFILMTDDTSLNK